MARAFASASSQYLAYTAGALTAEPLTFAAWVYPLQTNAACGIIASSNDSSSDGQYLLSLSSGGVVLANKENISGSQAASALSSASYSANAWQHACAVFSADNLRAAYLNGGSKGTSGLSVEDPLSDNISVGCKVNNTANTFMNGSIAHAAIWSAALTDDEVSRLYGGGIGLDPRSIRPDALVAYWPLMNNDGDQDYWGNYHLTASGSPTYAQHPPVLMRSRPKYVVIGAASGAPTISSVTITGTRTVSNTLTANVVTNPGTVDSIAYQWEISDDGGDPPTNGADLTGETAATLALTYADFASRLDANGEAYVRVGAIATVGAESSAESFSDWVRVTAGGSGVVRPIGQSVYISV